MSLYGTEQITSMESVANSDHILEMFIVDDVLHGTSDQIHEFVESEQAKVLQERNVLKRPTLVRLSKKDDEKRRIKLIAYQLAKDANDPEWTKLEKYQKLRKESINKIMRKYGSKAQRMAKIAQKNYIKTAKKLPATKMDKMK